MATIDMRKFDDVRHLVRARLLSSEFHDLEKIVKEHIAADVWKTYYLALPAPDGCAPWDITYSLLEQWPDVTINDLSAASAENEAGTQTMMKMSEVLQAYKFFGRHLPWSVFRSVCNVSSFVRHSIRQNPSRSRRDIIIEPSSLGTSPNIRKALDLRDFLDVSMSFTWVYYKAKGYKKSLMP